MELIEEKINGIEQEVTLNDLSEFGEVIELMDEQLWVVQNVGGEGYDELHFVTFHCWDTSKSDKFIEVRSLFLIQGFSEVLREGRHTYFPDKGYSFYMNAEHMKTALDYCTKYFDMN